MPDRVEFLTGVVGEGWWADITLGRVRRALGAGDVTLVLHSPGGDAAAGMAIAGAIRRHKGKVRIEIDGMAASAASAIAVAGDELVMAPGAMLMVHEPFGFAGGTRRDIMEVVRTMESFVGSYAAHYAANTPLTEQQARDAMEAVTWWTAPQAVELGLAKQEQTGRPTPSAPPDKQEIQEQEQEEDERDEPMMIAAWAAVAAFSGKKKGGRLTHSLQNPTIADMNSKKYLDPGGAAGSGAAPGPGQTKADDPPVKPAVSAEFMELELKDGTSALAIPQAAWASAQAEITKLTELVGELQAKIGEQDREQLEGKVDALLASAHADGRIRETDHVEWQDRLLNNFDAMAPVVEGLRPNMMFKERGSSMAHVDSGQVLGHSRRQALLSAGWTPEQVEDYGKTIAGDHVAKAGRTA